MHKITQVILNNLDKDDLQTATDRLNRAQNKLDDINNIFVKYYVMRGVNNKTLFGSFKNQKSYLPSNKKSFACLLVPELANTIQSGMLGQFDSTYYDIMLEIYNKVCAKIPVLQDEASKIFTCMGALPTPLNVEPPSSRKAREDIGLSSDTPEEFNVTLRAFVRDMLQRNCNKPDNHVAKITSNGNPGMPEFIGHKSAILSSSTSAYKERSFSIFKHAQALNFEKLILNGKVERLFNDCDLERSFIEDELLFMYRDQHRGQPDSSKKERYASTISSWDLDCIRQNRGHVEKQDKRYAINTYYRNYSHLHKNYGEFQVQSKKWRLVFAESNSVNGPLNLILAPIRKNYGDRYAKTFKVSDRKTLQQSFDELIASKKIDLRNYDFLCFDITQYDNSFSRGMMKAYIQGVDDFNPNLAAMIALENGAPGGEMLPYDGLDIKSIRNQLFLTGNPFDINTFNFGIAPSGTGEVTEKAKWPCLWFVIYSFLKASNTSYNFKLIEDIMTWNNEDIFICNLGDNNIVLSKKKWRMPNILKESSILAIDVSESGVFGGLVVTKDDKLNRVIVKNSAVSTLIKTLMPERTLDDMMRSSYFLGTIERYQLANDSQEIADVLHSIDSTLWNYYRAPSQYQLAKERLARSNQADVSELWRELDIYIRDHGASALSSFFLSVINSGGDKLFYTDLYDSMSDAEKKIIDNLFFTTFEDGEVEKTLKFGGIK